MQLRDRFGNEFAPTLSYARGKILASTEDDFRRLQQAWRFIGKRMRSGDEEDATFVFTGLEHTIPMTGSELKYADDEIAPALYFDRLKNAALEQLGGVADRDDVAVFNRLTGATLATCLTLVRAGDTVIGSSATHSHPSVIRAARQAGANFIDTSGAADFLKVLAAEPRTSLVVLTRLATTYDLMPVEEINQVVKAAHDRSIVVYIDDAGGARVGPALFDQPTMLGLGVDVGATGLDKYGTIGPRLGVMAGRSDLVGRIRAKGFECGLEARQALYPAVARSLSQYTPQRVRDLVRATKEVAEALRPYYGERLHETPCTVQLKAEDILEIAMQRAGVNHPPIVPLEANAAICMMMLRDYGMITVHFVGLPPGGANLLLKFIPPETLARFGGADKFAAAVDQSITKLGQLLKEPEEIRTLLLGDAAIGRKAA